MKTMKKIASVLMATMLLTLFIPCVAFATENDLTPESNYDIENQENPPSSNENNDLISVNEEEDDGLGVEGEDQLESSEAVEIDDKEDGTKELERETTVNETGEEDELLDNTEGEGEDSSLTGTCGTNLNWTYKEGVLTISGTGPMTDWSNTSHSPFFSLEISTIVIEEGVTSIGAFAFYQCSSVSNVELPQTLTSVGGSSFNGCTSLQSIDLPDSVQGIGTYPFSGCTFKKFVFPRGATTLYGNELSGCSFDMAFIPNTVKSMKGSYKEQTIYIGQYVLKNDRNTFYNSSGKRQVYCEAESKPVNWESGWEGNVSFTDIHYGVSYDAFLFLSQSFDGVKKVDVPEYVTNIYDVFKDNTSIEEVTLPSSMNVLSQDAFSGCSSLKEITLPDSVTAIGDNAFSGCTSLKEITLPDSITKIGSSAFSNCILLEQLELPPNLEKINARICANCTSLKYVYVKYAIFSTDIFNNGTSYPNSFPFKNCNEDLVIFTLTDRESSSTYGAPGILGRVATEGDKRYKYYLSCSKDYYLFYKNLTGNEEMISIPQGLGSCNISTFENFDQLSCLALSIKNNRFTNNRTILSGDAGETLHLDYLYIQDADAGSFSISKKLLSGLKALYCDTDEETFSSVSNYLYKNITCPAYYSVSNIRDISKLTITDIPAVKYKGNNTKIEITIEDDGNTLVEGEDYKVTLELSLENQLVDVTIAGMNGFYGQVTKQSELIIPRSTDVRIPEIEDQKYTGRRITPELNVNIDNTVLSEGTDYSVDYRDNTNIGTATVCITLADYFSGDRQVITHFNIVNNPDLVSGEEGYCLTAHAGKTIKEWHKEGDVIQIHDLNDVAFQSFQRWVIQSGDFTIPESQARNRTLTIIMPASDISIKAVYNGQSLKEDLADENSRYNAIVFRASILDANIELYTNTANSIKNKYGVSYLQSSTYYANQAASTQNTITQKQNRLAALRADTAGGHQVEIKQLEAEIKQLQSDYQMYLELSSAAQYKEKADAAQKERNTINLTTEARTHNNNIASICASHGVKNETVNEIQYIRLDKDEYEYTGSTIHPVITVIDSTGRKLGNESYEVVYPSDCISQGEHVITLNLKGNYTGKKTKIFNIVKHTYGEWVVTEAATCTKEGTRERTCSECGKKVTEPFLAPHNYGEWKTTKAATELAAGKKSRTCSTCGKTETKTIAQLKPTLPAITIVTPVAAKKAATIKWKKVNAKNQKKIAKIQIQYSTDKNFKKKVKTVYAKKTATSKKITKLMSKKTYYVRIRAYKKSGNKVHVSKWSTKKSVKIK